MRRFIAICMAAALATGFYLATGSAPIYAATVSAATASTDRPVINVIAGSDRYDTAIRVSQAGFPQGAPAVVIASGAAFPDALSAAPLAYAYGGPLLLTPTGTLTPALMNELRRLHPSRVFLVGIDPEPRGARSQVADLVGAGAVTVLVGQNRYKTAVLVANQLEAKLGAITKVVIVSGDLFADALSAAPLASANGWPILLASGEQDLPQVTRDALENLEVTSVLEVGTRAPVDVADVTRIAGADRYETSAMTAEYALTQGLASAHIAMVTGEDFPDGIAAAPYLALDGGILLLTEGGELVQL